MAFSFNLGREHSLLPWVSPPLSDEKAYAWRIIEHKSNRNSASRRWHPYHDCVRPKMMLLQVIRDVAYQIVQGGDHRHGDLGIALVCSTRYSSLVDIHVALWSFKGRVD